MFYNLVSPRDVLLLHSNRHESFHLGSDVVNTSLTMLASCTLFLDHHITIFTTDGLVPREKQSLFCGQDLIHIQYQFYKSWD